MNISAELRDSFSGIAGILVTPFDERDEITPDGLRAIVDRAIAAGVHNLVVNGNTSEFYGLRPEEAAAMTQAVVSMVDGRVPVIAGVGRSVHEACALAVSACEAGVSAVMVHQPPDPFVSPRGFVNYVRTVGEAVPDLPLVLYLRNDNIGLEIVKELVELPRVVAVKWATPSTMLLTQAIRDCRSDVIWIGGLAETWAPTFGALGVTGFTSGLINVWPERSVDIHTAIVAGDFAEARRLIAEIAAFEEIRAEENSGTNVSCVKQALRLTGLDCGPARAPSAWPLTARQDDRLRTLIASWPDRAA